jgi:CRP/FNR family transcriptional regulator
MMEHRDTVMDVGALRQIFPAFDQRELAEWLLENGLIKTFPAQSSLMHAGSTVQYVPLVLTGSVKVSREDAEGREIFLYYIVRGETCAMTLNACFKHEKSRVNALTQEETTLLLVPAHLVVDAARKFPSWQRFAFDSFGRRYDELLLALESVVFHQLDERLRHYLLEKAATLQTSELHVSQQQIADDLNSSREVISRLIRQFEQKGFLQHARGVIKIMRPV